MIYKGTTILVIVAVIFIALFIGVAITDNYKQENSAYFKPPIALNFNPATDPWCANNKEGTVTKIGPRRTYWKVPKVKRKSGGWDSIEGWWCSDSPSRFCETYLNVF